MSINFKINISSKASLLIGISAFLLLLSCITLATSVNASLPTLTSIVPQANSPSNNIFTDSSGTIQILINTADMSGHQINGIWTTLQYQNGTTVTSGFTPDKFVLNSGTTYIINAGNSWKYRFSHWDNGNTSNSYTITPTKNATLNAYYVTLPGSPTGLVAKATSSQIDLNWIASKNDGGSPIIGYKIERSTGGCTIWTTIVGNTASTATTYYDTGLVPDTAYMYRISEINSLGKGSPSSIVTVITNNTSISPPSLATRLDGNTTGVNYPLYSICEMSQVFTAKKSFPHVPLIVDINPSSGPGNSSSRDWASAVTQLKSVGAVVLGYVPTGYGSDDISTIENMISSYSQFYPGKLDGITLDEVSSSCSKDHFYQAITDYARSIGYSYIRANVGTFMCKHEIPLYDHVGIYESTSYPDKVMVESRTFSGQYSKSEVGFGVTVHSQPTLNPLWLQMATQYLKWVYITDQNGTNPYTEPPSYFNQYLSDLSKIAASQMTSTPS